MSSGATGPEQGNTKRAVDDIAALSQTFLNGWKQRASKSAGRLDSGGLTADQAAQDLADWTTFGLRSFALASTLAFEIAATLHGTGKAPTHTDSETFATKKAASGARALKLAGPLVADVGSDQIAVDRVSIVPSELKAGESEFKLVAETVGHHSVGYSGVVEVRTAAGKLVDSVGVFLMAI